LRGDEFSPISESKSVCLSLEAFPELGTTAVVMIGVEFVMLPLDFIQAKIHNYFKAPKDECEVCINSNSSVLSMPLEVVLSRKGVELKIMRGETLMA
jgi:hypothetical protein